MIPYPFTRVVFAYGDPIFVARSADEAQMEALRAGVEAGLMEALRRAEEALSEESLWKA
jgi:lysophospholipid acyltransferase (LPLAT)-like uncharacterized protein